MITKINKNVLLVKEIPSNLIEEAILILKTEDKKIKTKTKEILMVEANDIIRDCSMKLQNEIDNDKKRKREEESKKKRIKTNLVTVLGFVIFATIIAILIFASNMKH